MDLGFFYKEDFILTLYNIGLVGMNASTQALPAVDGKHICISDHADRGLICMAVGPLLSLSVDGLPWPWRLSLRMSQYLTYCKANRQNDV